MNSDLTEKKVSLAKKIFSKKNVEKGEKGATIAGAVVVIFGGILKIIKMITQNK